jgi:hypothetical protein
MRSLSGPNQPVNGAATFSFSAMSDSTLGGFECRIGGVHEWRGCGSGYVPNLATGAYTLQVRAVDYSGNRSGESTCSDGGLTWTINANTKSSICTGGTAANGGDYERASDPWVDFSNTA